ncbi:MAG TPA: phosphate ABC transporter substrate-binding protein [Polyangiaceae bacterium]|nr:phosphate ABC transporter substrate-binding protein [Polyangiaceae bacterium]
MRGSLVALAVLLTLAAACARKPSAALTLSGSTSIQPLAEKWVEAYRVGHDALTIAVQGGGSTAGVQAILSGTAQIGMVSRALSPEERRQVHEIVVARDAIAIVVHPTNPVGDLSLDDVRDLYTGAIGNWRALGGPARPVSLITREEGSGTRTAFEGSVMRGQTIAPGALVQDSTGAVRQMVGSDPAAIGYISLGLVDRSVKALRLNGVPPTEQSVDDASYALTRPFLFALRGEPSRAAAQFIQWIHGPEGTALTRAEGFLPPLSEPAHARQ